VVAVDIVSSSSGDRFRQIHLDQALDKVLDDVLEVLHNSVHSAHAAFRRNDGDSAMITFPGGIPKAWIAADLVLRECRIALADANRSVTPEHQLRLRVALDSGEIVVNPPHIDGDAVVRAARLRDAEQLRAAMRAAPAAHLGLIVSDRFFTDVIDHRERGLDPALFHQVDVSVKTFHERAWIHVPGQVARPEIDRKAVMKDRPVSNIAKGHARVGTQVGNVTGNAYFGTSPTDDSLRDQMDELREALREARSQGRIDVDTFIAAGWELGEALSCLSVNGTYDRNGLVRALERLAVVVNGVALLESRVAAIASNARSER
jgi:class 3 adenylate cyclase